MPTIQIDEGHALTAEEAERRVRALGERLAAGFGLLAPAGAAVRVKGAVFTLQRTGASLAVTIEPARFRATLDLSFALTPLRARFEAAIRDGLRGVDA